MNKELNYCVILAGGIGARLWPMSRTEKPKQFLDLFGTGRTLLQQTYDRFSNIIDPDHIFVATNTQYASLLKEQLPEIRQDRVLYEPIRRNTLPSAAWATACIAHHCPNANIVASPADQLILKEEVFRNDILSGLTFVAQTDGLLTMGVRPTHPDTGYGYIQSGEEQINSVFSLVKSFTEKPNHDFARMFIESGEFYWNTGLFLWNTKTMLESIRELVPDYINSLTQMAESEHKDVTECIPEHFSALPNLSLDYGILERRKNVYVQACDFGWADLGNWNSIHDNAPRDSEENVLLDSQALLYQCKGNVVRLPKGKIAVIDGLKDFVIAEEGNVLMICPKNDPSALRRMMTDAQIKLGENFA